MSRHCDLFTVWKNFNYKPLDHVRWPTWKLSRASEQVYSLLLWQLQVESKLHCISENGFPGLEGTCEMLRRTHFSPVTCAALKLLCWEDGYM